MRFIYFVFAAALGLSACGGTQPTFDELQSEALALWDAKEAEDRTKWAAISPLTGSATYEGVGYFKATGSGVPADTFVRGQMTVDVAFGSGTPQMNGAITDFVAQTNFVDETEQTLAGELTFVVDATSLIFAPKDTIRYPAQLTGTLQAPGTDQIHEIDADIHGRFYGPDGQYLAGGITDDDGPLMINGGFVVEN
ncbi:MAG: hypothetical protein ACI82I_002464 [Gammaproteobacteria bacterium]|jgi:hypothetical protein